MVLSDFGATEGWGGHRATKAWYGLFGSSAQDLDDSSDDRAGLFWTNYLATDPTKIHSFEMNDYKAWTDGYPSIKFRNKNFVGSTVNSSFANTDFPLFRLADAYLMYAECAVRGGGGSLTQALQYVNDVRNRSHATPINASQLTLISF